MSKDRCATHVCLDCGALGGAGGYHDHGGDNAAGETIPLGSLPLVLRSFQRIENERDELVIERDTYRRALERIADDDLGSWDKAMRHARGVLDA